MTLQQHQEQVSSNLNNLGSFGRVRLATHKSSGKFCAIKVLKKAEIIKLKQVDHIMNETKIITMIDHPFLV